MIAIWMLYCIAIGLAFVIAGHALEQALRLAGRATRWAWVVALLGSYLVPTAAWLRPQSFASFPVPVSDLPPPSSTMPSAPITPETVTTPAASGIDWDGALRWGWGVASAALLIAFAIAMVRLAALRRRWRTCTVDGRLVLVSRDVGPAVVGVLQPRVVLPEWALVLTPEQRELLLAHEEQHMRARDPWLLVGGVIAIVLAPWNVALWWQWRRLRLAVETDCDARVLAAGRSAKAYGALLLAVGRRRTVQPLGAAAFGEPASFLESRIRRIVGEVPRWRWLGAALALVVASGAIVGACEAPRPTAADELGNTASVSSQLLRQLDSVAPELLAQLDSARPALLRSLDSVMAEQQRPWVRDNVERLFPWLLNERSGPPMDVWLMHDAHRRVLQGALLPRTREAIDTTTIRAVFKGFRAGNDGWGVLDRGALTGLLRDNVRVIWVHHDPTSRDLSAFEEHPEMLILPWVRREIIEHYPSLVDQRSGPPLELWFVADAQKRVLSTVQRPGPDQIRVGIDDILQVFPDLSANQVRSWSVTNRGRLSGLVRDNVRVVWVEVRQ